MIENLSFISWLIKSFNIPTKYTHPSLLIWQLKCLYIEQKINDYRIILLFYIFRTICRMNGAHTSWEIKNLLRMTAVVCQCDLKVYRVVKLIMKSKLSIFLQSNSVHVSILDFFFLGWKENSPLKCRFRPHICVNVKFLIRCAILIKRIVI